MGNRGPSERLIGDGFGTLWWPLRHATLVNPARHVGRNDRCPCGSGRKYKKCCLETDARQLHEQLEARTHRELSNDPQFNGG